MEFLPLTVGKRLHLLNLSRGRRELLLILCILFRFLSILFGFVGFLLSLL